RSVMPPTRKATSRKWWPRWQKSSRSPRRRARWRASSARGPRARRGGSAKASTWSRPATTPCSCAQQWRRRSRARGRS
ncbi:MAG: hypothetical protein AVDCRST_MAG90-2469, partial [uncultured Microvirga sp.]